MKKILYILAALIITLSGCEKYLDVNDNPNNATNATPNLVLPAVWQGVGYRTSMEMNVDFPDWMGYWAKADGWSGWFNLKKYEITAADWTGYFLNSYQGYLMDAHYCDVNSYKPEQAYYKAIAKVAKVVVFQSLVDAYGDVPYSEAFNTKILKPKYDDSQAIYDDLLNQLDSVIILCNKSASLCKNPGNDDIVFGGNMTKWKQFANTLKLRILLRQVYIPSRASYISTKIAAMSNDGYISYDVKVNPGYTAAKPQPFYNQWGWTSAGAEQQPHSQEVQNAYILKWYNDLSDLRKGQCFNWAISDHTWQGKQFGNEGDGITNRYNADKGNLIGHALCKKDSTATLGALVMSQFESLFLQAEAVQRGLIAGNAQTLYEDAVRANYLYLGLTLTHANTYLANVHEKVNWTNAPDKLELILFQKYMAFCGINGFEAWCEYRRTGIPDPKASDPLYSMLSYYNGVVKRVIPTRLYYPQREMNLNVDNVNAAILKTYGKPLDNQYQWSKVFWDVN